MPSCPGCKDHNDFAVRMGHDAVLVDPNFTKEPLSEGRYRSEWGYVGQKTQEEHGIEVESPIETMADFERYTPPDPLRAGPLRIGRKGVGAIRRPVRRHRPPQRRVFAARAISWAWRTCSWRSRPSPELIQALVDMSVEINLVMAKELVARGVQIVYTGR